ncbi:fam-a protein [Plasmodium vinckei lentum]|uniref:Fam-a protein n=1 Tax=Plasmodium vinckei lentum TaxID=138297 RepID=A0A6V7RVQ2_PLAVN|nr:fam-a protein [Plasmodium vinckei lentum]
MKVISVGLISLIIFNIVLANNTSDSGPTTGCCSLLEEKTKKTHKTTEESVNVKGKRPYKKGYEESYGDMVKDIFMPLEDDYQYSRNNSHKQDDAPPPISKGPEKQKFREERKLRTINENKEICQKPKDLLHTDPEKGTKTKEKTTEKTTEKTKSKSESPYLTDSPEEIFEKHKKFLCTNPEETKQAVELMDEAVVHLACHAANKDGSEPSKSGTGSSSLSHKKNDENTPKILKTNRRIYDFGMYNEIVNLIWNPENINFFINESAICERGKTTRKIVRVYNPNLVMIQQRCKKKRFGSEKYFYALAKKAQLSEDKTIIVMTSANINDQYPSKKEYKNTIIENANLFKTKIDSENDVQEGKLKKVFVNIAGYLIENIKNHIHVTYIESVNEEDST